MSKRNIEIKVRLNRKEMEVLDKRVKKAVFPEKATSATSLTAAFPVKHHPRTIMI